MLRKVSIILEKCKETGIEKNCLEKIKISKITEKVLNNNTVTPQDIKSLVNSLVIDQLNKIGNMSVYEVLDKVKIFKDKFELDVNKLEVGYNLVSYGLLLRAFNKFVYNRPIPPGLSAPDLVVLRMVRSLGRV
jgi:succinylglutamate desuccinylase